MSKIILVNQVTGPLFIDMANYYAETYSDVVLFTGKIEKTGASLHHKITIQKGIAYNRNNPLKRIFTWLVFTFQAYVFLKKQQQQADVLLVSNPPLAPLLPVYLKRKKNLCFHTLIYDIYPELLFKLGYLNKSSFIVKWWEKKNRESFQLSKNLFTITDGMKEVLSRYTPEVKWKVVYPWVDTSFIQPIPKKDNPFIAKYKLEGKTIIQYSGNMGASHDLMTLLKVAEQLQENSRYVFLMIGDGTQKKNLEAFVQKQELKNVLFLPFQDKETFPFSLAAADIGVVSLTDEASQMAIPSKTFYQMAAGNAILAITNLDSELGKIVKENKCGFVFSPGKDGDIVRVLRKTTAAEFLELQNKALQTCAKYDVNNVSKFKISKDENFTSE